MIGSLNGIIDYQEASSIIIDVNGVGYKVLVPVSMPLSLGDKVKLFIHTHVREDLLELYGFKEVQDLKLFEYLISVSGVGCKTALGVFSVGSRAEIIKAIIGNDVGFFTAVPRLGKKNAQKIIIEGILHISYCSLFTFLEKACVRAIARPSAASSGFGILLNPKIVLTICPT